MNKRRQRQQIEADDGFEQWGGYMQAKKSKLQDQFKKDAAKEGCSSNNVDEFEVLCVVPVPSADELRRIMLAHGGTYQHYEIPGKLTHVIATNLPDVKIKRLKNLRLCVVKPDWIMACLEAGFQVDYEPFLLYTHQSTSQPAISFPKEVQDPVKSTPEEKKNPVNENVNLKADIEKKNKSVEDVDVKDNSCNNEVKNSKNGEKSSNRNSSKCATEENFLTEFYNNSRLHHISTMGAMFKQHVTELRQKSDESFPGLEKLKDWKKNYKTNIPDDNFIQDDENDFNCAIDNNGEIIKAKKKQERVIMHIDMDCFFVSVGLRSHPELKGVPVAVTHSKGGANQPIRSNADRQYEFNYYKDRMESKFKKSNPDAEIEKSEESPKWFDSITDTDSLSEIASCSYEARKAGVKNGMFMGAALKLCPTLKTIPYDFEGYKEVAYTLYNTVSSYTLDIEAVSCDEMFVDCTDLLKASNTTPMEFASFIRAEIKEKTQCPASTGFGGNRLLARLATRKAKPDGQFYLQFTEVEEFMKNVNISDLPGVGRSMTYRLQSMGINTCAELQLLPLSKLKDFGNKTGETLYQNCRGIDDRPLNFWQQRKSVSAEVNYGIRFKNYEETEKFIRQLAGEVETRLSEVQMKGRCITLKLMIRAEDAPVETAKYMGHGVCDNISKSSTLSFATCEKDFIAREVLSIVKKLEVNPCDLRGIGIQMSRLESVSSNVTSGLEKFLIKQQPASSSNKNTHALENVFENPADVKALSSPAKPIISSPKDKKRDAKSPRSKSSVHKSVQSIDQFFASRKLSTRKDDVTKLPPPSQLDLEVFDALPEDIRDEILHEYTSRTDQGEAELKNDGVKSTTEFKKENEMDVAFSGDKNDVSLSQVDPTFLNALPKGLRNELESELLKKKLEKVKKQQQEEKNNKMDFRRNPTFCRRKTSLLSSLMTSQEVRSMIGTWISREKKPSARDINILKHYFYDLVLNRSIEELQITIKCLYRCIVKKKDISWVDAYEYIVSEVQDNMIHVYKSRLQVEDIVVLPSCSSMT